jgi:hypothetical protein
MLDRRSWIVVAVTLGFAPGGCKNTDDAPADSGAVPLAHKPASDDGGRSAGDDGGEPQPAADGGEKLLPSQTYAPLGNQPGYIGDGFIYAAFRAKETHAWLKTLPIPSDVEREATRAESEIGFNPLRTDWLEYFAVPADAVVSVTLLRPLDDGIGAARIALADATKEYATEYDEYGRVFGEKKAEEWKEERKEDAKAETKAEEAEEAKEDPMPIAFVPPKPPPPPPPPADLEEEELPPVGIEEPFAAPEPEPKVELPAPIAALGAMGFHSRVHLPSSDVAKTHQALARMFDAEDHRRGDEACAGIPDVECVSDGRAVIALRDESAAVVIDFVAFESRLEDSSVTWSPVVRKAISARPAKVPNADAMGGHAAMWLDPSQLSRLAAVDKLGSVVRNLEWDPDWKSNGASNLARLEKIDALVAATRMFTGVRVEAVAEGESLAARATWPLAEQGMVGRIGASLLASRPSSAQVPTVAALCDGALMCMRTQRLPDARPLLKRLAVDGFGGSAKEVFDRLDRDEEYTFTLLMGGAWANLLAASMTIPDAMDGTEATVARTVLDAMMRAEGYGGALQSLSISGFLRFDLKYALYVLAKPQDVQAASGLLSLAGQSTTPLQVPDHGTAQVFDTRNDAPRGQLVFHPPEETKDEDATPPGWIALVDATDRYTWLRARELEADAGPPAYFEIPDLWDVFIAFDASSREFDFARAWLKRRAFKVVLDTAEGGAPRMRASLATRQ